MMVSDALVCFTAEATPLVKIGSVAFIAAGLRVPRPVKCSCA